MKVFNLKIMLFVLAITVLFVGCENKEPEPEPEKPEGTEVVELTVIPIDNIVQFYAVAGTVSVDWGDGKSNTYSAVNTSTEIKHTFENNNLRTVEITAQGLTYFGDAEFVGGGAMLMEPSIKGQLQRLSFTSCTGLNEISVMYTGLKEISKNTALVNLYCMLNQLTALDISKNIALQMFNCSGNLLTALDASENTALTRLYCAGNLLDVLELNDLFANLPQHSSGDYNIVILDNPGSFDCDTSIANGRGWGVVFRI